MMQEARLILFPVLLFGAAGFAERPVSRDPRPSPQTQSSTMAKAAGPGAAAGSSVRVLFVGNSLTMAHDLPSLVQAMAAAGGVKLTYDTCTSGGSNLEDHWNRGRCRRTLSQGKWDFVVLQQGPSTQPDSQAHLREWGKKWAAEAHRQRARTAFYMVWPQQGQRNGFELVSQSYRNASIAAGGLLLPAGDAWQSVIQQASIRLYQPDGLHPTIEGSYLAGLVITQGLTGVKPASVPARLTLASGRKVDLPPDRVRRLQKGAEGVADANPAPSTDRE